VLCNQSLYRNQTSGVLIIWRKGHWKLRYFFDDKCLISKNFTRLYRKPVVYWTNSHTMLMLKPGDTWVAITARAIDIDNLMLFVFIFPTTVYERSIVRRSPSPQTYLWTKIWWKKSSLHSIHRQWPVWWGNPQSSIFLFLPHCWSIQFVNVMIWFNTTPVITALGDLNDSFSLTSYYDHQQISYTY